MVLGKKTHNIEKGRKGPERPCKAMLRRHGGVGSVRRQWSGFVSVRCGFVSPQKSDCVWRPVVLLFLLWMLLRCSVRVDLVGVVVVVAFALWC